MPGRKRGDIIAAAADQHVTLGDSQPLFKLGKRLAFHGPELVVCRKGKQREAFESPVRGTGCIITL
ncbi:hypothetical protein D3C80_2022350 [compost metagenome]